MSSAACQQTTAPISSPKLTYPVAKKGDVVDDYFGTKVADPYRWMEDLDSQDVADWVAAAERGDVRVSRTRCRCASASTQRLTELWNYPQRRASARSKAAAVLREEHRAAAPVADLRAREPDARRRRS